MMDNLNRILHDPANHDILTLIKAVRNGLVYGTKVRLPHALVMVFLFKSGTLRQKALQVFAATRQHARNLALFAFTYKAQMLLLRRLHLSTYILTSRRGPAYMPEAKHASSSIASRSRESQLDAFLAGLTSGYLVFGRGAGGASSVNQQIVIYVFARAMLGIAKLAFAPSAPRQAGWQAGYSGMHKGGPGLGEWLVGERGLLGVGLSAEQREVWRRRIVNNAWAVFASVSWAMVMWLFRWHPDVLQPSLRSSMKYLYDNAEEWSDWKDWIWHNR